jgi:light-regulated signal transduction histidine kinase (bacteriophytochrome)
MLVADRNTLGVTHAAGDLEGRLGVGGWSGKSLGLLIGDKLAGRIARMSESGAITGFVGVLNSAHEAFDVSVHVSGAHLVVELEPSLKDPPPASSVLGALAAAGAAFERAGDLRALCDRAALEFRRLTGFDRVMIYQFQEDGAGAVLAESKVEELPSFLNHHFPGSDIPRQARALYVRNLVRTIPDVFYEPAPLRPAWNEPQPLDMSDSILRSVSPVHMQYMRNMGVAASASISIVKDGALWGLVACHHQRPRGLAYDVRAAAAALAGGLARQIRAKEDAELYRERIRLRSFEDRLVASIGTEASVTAGLEERLPDLARMMASDGVAALVGNQLSRFGATPDEVQLRTLAGWVLSQPPGDPVATETLAAVMPQAEAFREVASGLLAAVVSTEQPMALMWFRAEQVQVIEWAGNPHKDLALKPGEALTPRASFEAWSDTVRGHARPWSLPEVEAAARLRQALQDLQRRQRLVDLNRSLGEAVAAKEQALQQKEFLLREVDHRVQNSLQLVSAFLGLQARELAEPALKQPFAEAQRRLSAVAMVHRRLYRSDQIELIDLGRYIEDLTGEMLKGMDAPWRDQVSLDLAPVVISTDRAVSVGLILTELVINANKYAYGGAAGPILISLDQSRSDFRMTAADRGRGKHGHGGGFGSRMMAAMVQQLHGELAYEDNRPGLSAVLTAPLSVKT